MRRVYEMCISLLTASSAVTRLWTVTMCFGRRSTPMCCMVRTIRAPALSINGSPPSTDRLVRGQAAWSKNPIALVSQRMYTLKPKRYLPSANSNSTWEYGYQYPETLVEWTNKQRLDAVWATIVKYYAPAGSASKEYPPGAIHRGDRLTQPGYPVDLPGMIAVPHVRCIRLTVAVVQIRPLSGASGGC